MSITNPGPRRVCRRCGHRKLDHVQDLCRDGRVFKATEKNENLASNSFNPREIKLGLAFLLNAAKGYDSRQLARDPAYPGLCRKFQAMQKKFERQREDKVVTEAK